MSHTLLLRAPEPLPRLQKAVSVLTYNVLLPNSKDGWWMYKMYPPGSLTNNAQASWEERSKLLQKSIHNADADIVCLQEVSGESFESDFKFMRTLGYTNHALYRKGRFRPATFWKPSLELESVSHGDRCLITTFRKLNESGETQNERLKNNLSENKTFAVINCHLQAGRHQGARRLRQVSEATQTVYKAVKKNSTPTPGKKKKKCDPETTFTPIPPEKYPIILCGDLNGGDESAAVRWLEDGYVDTTFIEDGIRITPKKPKVSVHGKWLDASACVRQRPPPPTMVVMELISRLSERESQDMGREVCEGTSEGVGESENEGARGVILSKEAIVCLQGMFCDFAKGKDWMDKTDVTQWLVTINGCLGRGSEFRAALAAMKANVNMDGSVAEKKSDSVRDCSSQDKEVVQDSAQKAAELPVNGRLAWTDFRKIYEAELCSGKYWGVAHDFHVCGHPLVGIKANGGADQVFCARFDRIYVGGGLCARDVLAVRDSVSYTACPNIDQPSDHLPVGVVVRVA
eukprot:CFRG7445T1